ncbi:MAG: hypothetical protein P1U89_16340 [Verrucomicrobiales bacterium]|nr:hypothetical protein [Verrucomicrobiales bacterium]
MKVLSVVSLLVALSITPVFAQFHSKTTEVQKNENKLKSIRIPSVEFSDTPLADALQFIQAKSVELDLEEAEPAKKGVNIILKGEGSGQTPITLRLTNAPLGEVLRYTVSLAQLKYRVEPHAVTVIPLTEPGTELFTNQYTVPPSFLSSGARDPFAPPASTGVRAPSAKHILESAGISFSNGASAVYNPGSSSLIVRNTPDQMELVEAYIESIKGVVEKYIYLSATVVTSTEPILEMDENDADRPTAPDAISRSFDRWDEMKNFLYSAELTKETEAVRKRAAYRKEHQTGALKLLGVQTPPQFQILLRTVSKKEGAELLNLEPVTIRSGKSVCFSAGQLAMGAAAVLGADNYTIDLKLLARNLDEPLVENEAALQLSVSDGQTVLIGGKVGPEKYRLMAIRADIHDPAGLKINKENRPPEPKGEGKGAQ